MRVEQGRVSSGSVRRCDAKQEAGPRPSLRPLGSALRMALKLEGGDKM